MFASALVLLFFMPSPPIPVAAPSSPAAEIAACADWIRTETGRDPLNTARTKNLSPRTFCFSGDIMPWTVADLSTWLAAARTVPGPVQLVMRSPGGDAAMGIALAEKLRALDASVTVVDYCMSSCANYIFGAVDDRNILDRAAVLFHGGYDPSRRDAYIATLDAVSDKPDMMKHIPDFAAWKRGQIASFDDHVARQAALYADAGVDIALLTEADSFDPESLPANLCGPRADAERSTFFLPSSGYAAVGMPVRSGVAMDDPAEVDRLMEGFGFPSTACRAPDDFLQPHTQDKKTGG